MNLAAPVSSRSVLKRPVVLRDVAGVDRVLTPDAIAFVADLHFHFGAHLYTLRDARARRQDGFDNGLLPEFLIETNDIRNGVWEAAKVPEALFDRRVEISSPPDRARLLEASNCGANVVIADFDDACPPRFNTLIAGQIALLDYRDEVLAYDHHSDASSKPAFDRPTVLFMRPRSLHLNEANVVLGGVPVAATFFDFGLHAFHHARKLAQSARGPFYYLPKIENHREARLWNSIMSFTEKNLGLPAGTIKVTVEIGTLRAAFEMDEIIWELRDRIVGLSCECCNLASSYIKSLAAHRDYVLPDRNKIAQDSAFLASVSALLVQTCHRRGIHAIRGMAAQSVQHEGGPGTEPRARYGRDVQAGYDGTRVAHRDQVRDAKHAFDDHMPLANQIRRPHQQSRVTAEFLLKPHCAEITEDGLRSNISEAVEYLAQWLSGHGAAESRNMAQDAATAELARSQVSQWLRHGVTVQLSTGGSRTLDAGWLAAIIQSEIEGILARLGATGFHRGRYASAIRIVHDATVAGTMPDFITTPAYTVLNALD